MTALDLTALDDLMTDLRHSTGDRRIEQLQALHDLLDLADVVQGLQHTKRALRHLEWSGRHGDHRACASCGSPAVADHVAGCGVARAVRWLA